MKYFPMNLDIRDKKVLVVGGGEVARRKIRTLLECGANITVVSPEFTASLLKTKGITIVEREYRKSDITGAHLIISATNSQAINELVSKHANTAGIPVNVVDVPDLCSFTVPATTSKGSLVITISTGGGSPALSRRIRERIEKEMSPSLIQQLKLLEEIRPAVKDSGLTITQRSRLLKRMATEKVQKVIANKGVKEGSKLINSMLSEAIKKNK